MRPASLSQLEPYLLGKINSTDHRRTMMKTLIIEWMVLDNSQLESKVPKSALVIDI